MDALKRAMSSSEAIFLVLGLQIADQAAKNVNVPIAVLLPLALYLSMAIHDTASGMVRITKAAVSRLKRSKPSSEGMVAERDPTELQSKDTTKRLRLSPREEEVEMGSCRECQEDSGESDEDERSEILEDTASGDQASVGCSDDLCEEEAGSNICAIRSDSPDLLHRVIMSQATEINEICASPRSETSDTESSVDEMSEDDESSRPGTPDPSISGASSLEEAPLTPSQRRLIETQSKEDLLTCFVELDHFRNCVPSACMIFGNDSECSNAQLLFDSGDSQDQADLISMLWTHARRCDEPNCQVPTCVRRRHLSKV